MLRECAIFISLAMAIRAKFEGFVVGSGPADIEQYPHAVFLSVACVNKQKEKNNWRCGSSVVNQKLLLTAGHCISDCFTGTKLLLNRKDEGRNVGVITSSGFVIHQKYHGRTFDYDIALIKLKLEMKMNSMLSRVALMKNPPYYEPAFIAGWGLMDESTDTYPTQLKHVDQTVWAHNDCEEELGIMPLGTICGSSKNKNDHPSMGDSGSALVVRGYIQIGVVAYRKESVNVVVYTDVGYFYNWIKDNAARLYCNN